MNEDVDDPGTFQCKKMVDMPVEFLILVLQVPGNSLIQVSHCTACIYVISGRDSPTPESPGFEL